MILLGPFINNYLNIFRKPKNKISIIKHLVKPPYGGGNQFILGLIKELRKKHLVYNNYFSKDIKTFIFDSIWLSNYEIMKLDEMKKNGAKIIHRVDGPLQIYRMKNPKEDINYDNKLLNLNHKLANVTIVQSKFALKKFESLGYYFKNPVIVHNASDSNVFFPKNKNRFKKIKLISTSWSTNEKKGKKIFDWRDKNLDFEKYDFDFIGRINSNFKNINHISPMNSVQLAKKLQSADIYVFASINETCSNSLIEALTCGLPTVYIDSGSNKEIVKKGGLSFKKVEEIPSILKKISNKYDYYKKSINIERMDQIAKKYSLFF